MELLLNHLTDDVGEYMVVDMTAGADSFASGLFTRFDVMFLVCEPTSRSVGAEVLPPLRDQTQPQPVGHSKLVS